MQELEQARNGIAGLYWIALLVTAKPELSLDITLQAIEREDNLDFLTFSRPLARLRTAIITKALAAVKDEIAASAALTRSWQPGSDCIPITPGWSLDPGTSKSELESALLAIDFFPRCVLLLTLFEGLAITDTARLLNSNRELVLIGQMAAVRKLTINFTSAQGWRPVVDIPQMSRQAGSAIGLRTGRI